MPERSGGKLKPHLWLIRATGVLVPRRLRADWRQEWEAELRCREELLAEWDRLDWRNRLDLLWRSLGAFWDALALQPRRLEDEMVQDLRYGIRILWRKPGFALPAILMLALGIGATTAIFSVVNAVLLRPLPYPQADRMVLLWGNFLKLNISQLRAKPAEYVDYRDRTQSFEQVAAFNTADLNLTGSGEPERIMGARVTANLFPLLDARAERGRVIAAEEMEPGRNDVVVISHAFWQRRMGGAADVIGRGLRLDDRNHTIIGVMPPAFAFPHASFNFAEPAELWLPLLLDAEQVAGRSGPYAVNVLARLKPEASLARAQAEMSAMAQQFERDLRGYRGPNNADGGWRISVVPLREQVVDASRRALWVLFGAVGLVLLIACANVANLLLVRATARRKELAIRAALGAGRGRIVRQLLIESLLLAGLSGLLGWWLAWWGVRALASLSPANLPRVAEVNLDARVLGFASLVSLLTGVFLGLAPALHASKLDLQQALRATGGAQRTAMRHLRHEWLTIVEVALALPLLIGVGLLLNSFARLQRVDPGVAVDKVLVAQIDLPGAKYRENARATAFFDELARGVRGLPGVEEASYGTQAILSGAAINDPFSIEGHPMDFNKPNVAGWQRVAPGYFRTLGIPLIAGRDFTAADNEIAPVAVINETLARRYFPAGDALGQRITPGLPRPENPYAKIIGVVRDIPHRTVESAPEPDFFLPYARQPRLTAHLFVRAKGDPANLASAVRGIVTTIDRDQPVKSFKTMQDVIAATNAPRRFTTLLLGGFALVALALAALGIYSVNAYTVAQRAQEIGIRMALGAQVRDVLRMVLRRGLLQVLAGAALGLPAALALTRLLKSMLFSVSATDPLTFCVVVMLLLLVALLACYIPARRAAKVDPLAALRHD